MSCKFATLVVRKKNDQNRMFSFFLTRLRMPNSQSHRRKPEKQPAFVEMMVVLSYCCFYLAVWSRILRRRHSSDFRMAFLRFFVSVTWMGTKEARSALCTGVFTKINSFIWFSCVNLMLLPQSVSLSTEYGAGACSWIFEVVRAINIGQHMWNLTLLINIIYCYIF